MIYGLLLAGVPGVVLLDRADAAAWCLLAVTVLGCLAAAAHPWTVIRAGTLVLAIWSVLALVLLRDESLGYGLIGLTIAAASQGLAWLVGSWAYGMRATSPRRTS